MRKLVTLMFALVALSASAQLNFSGAPNGPKKLDRAALPAKKPMTIDASRAITNIALDYDSFDVRWKNQNTPPDSMYYYSWGVNNNYRNTTEYTLRYITQSYDTLADVNNNFAGTPKQGTTITVDSFDILLAHDNQSGLNDTLIISVYDKSAATVTGAGINGKLNTTPLWSDTIIDNQDFLPTDSLFYFLTFKPNVTLPAGHTFGIRVDFMGDTTDAVYIIASFRDKCSSQALGDTNKLAPRNTSYYFNLSNGSGFFNYTTNHAYNTPAACDYWIIQNLLVYPYVTLNTGSSGSACTPDPNVSSGLAPTSDNVPCIQQGVSFSQTYTFKVPAAAGPIPITSVSFTGIDNLPAGLTATFSKNPATYTGGETGCFIVTGTTNAACGQYWMKVNVSINGVLTGELSSLATQYGLSGFPKNFLRVVGQGGTCPAVDNNQTQDFVAGSCGTSSGITASATATNVNCFGQATGTATATGNGGSNYTYLWSNGQTTATATGLAAGTYTVTVTSGNSTATATATVTQPNSALTASATATTTTCGTSNGTASVTANGGTPNYTYLWNNNSTSATLNGLGAGNYSVTVSDSKGCTATASTAVTTPNGPQATAVATPVTCFGTNTGSVDATVTGGTGTLVYAWSNGASTVDISNLGVNTYTLTVTDGNNCSFSVAATVSGPSAAVSVSGQATNNTGGNNGAVNITAAGGTGGYTYNWSNSTTTEDLTGLGAGTYTVTVTDQAGCTATASFTVATTIGINDMEMVSKFTLFPNPANAMVNVQVALTEITDTKIELVDLTGKVILTENTGKTNLINHVVNLNNVPAGVYAVRVSGSKFNAVKQITITR
ncbi:MAG TPA: T9SS type A sorting domain-containing protein [Chitinophagales bacterium]|nr:T9SS type A sorting domain-containing protein [Chitinophagales bacterium]